MLIIHDAKELTKMRAACKLAAEILEKTGKQVRPGVSTEFLNNYALKLATEAGAVMAPYGYKINPEDVPFPKHICTSRNNVVCHGIPNPKEIVKNGDILNIDVTVILDGFHGDTSKTFLVGKCSPQAKKLVEVAEAAMHEGINAAKAGECISNIGLAIENYVKPFNYGIVEELTGHGVGRSFHQEPTVFHYHNPSYKLKLKPGIIMTCEPMINLGSKAVRLLGDGWTIVTADGKLSAQFEHTIAITEQGTEILTQA